MIKDEIAGRYNRLNGHEFGQTVRDSEGQVRLPSLQTGVLHFMGSQSQT